MDSHLSNRQRVLAAMAVLHGGADAAEIADYMSDSNRGVCGDLIALYSEGADRENRAQQLIRQAVAAERFSSLAEVHPAWILERLCEEPPRVIGIILRSLPSQHVRYILKNMPPMLRAQLPNMVESFAVAAPVLEVIRRRFERHFLPMPVSRAIGKFDFSKLYYLKGEDLEEVIREAGLTELGIALTGMAGKVLHVVLNRLELKDAKRLQGRMRDMRGISPELVRQARFTVLEVEGRRVGPDGMLMRFGLAALASALGDEHTRLVRLLQQRLDPSDGYLLKRFIDERRICPRRALAAERRDMILWIVASLAEDGRIDPSWGRFFTSETPSPDSGEPASGGISDEITASLSSVQQLA
ncbi:MAG: hypothetical protein V2A66_09900 [Pseudomonadota bacterium]